MDAQRLVASAAAASDPGRNSAISNPRIEWRLQANALIEQFILIYGFGKWTKNRLSRKVKPNCLKSRLIGKFG
jgi:hypothetical protein